MVVVGFFVFVLVFVLVWFGFLTSIRNAFFFQFLISSIYIKKKKLKARSLLVPSLMGQWHGLQTAESALLAAVDPAHRDNTSQVNLARLQTKINGRWWSPEELSYRPANICTSADRGLVEFSRLLSNSSSVNGKALGIGFLQGEGRLSLILDILM